MQLTKIEFKVSRWQCSKCLKSTRSAFMSGKRCGYFGFRGQKVFGLGASQSVAAFDGPTDPGSESRFCKDQRIAVI